MNAKPRARRGKKEPFSSGVLLTLHLLHGRALNRHSVCDLTGVSRAQAMRYLLELERLVPGITTIDEVLGGSKSRPRTLQWQFTHRARTSPGVSLTHQGAAR